VLLHPSKHRRYVAPVKRWLATGLRWDHAAIAVSAALILSSCSPATSQPTPSHRTGTPTPASPSIASLSWNYLAFGDSWPEGAHCDGCRTFAGLWADDLPALAGRPIVFTDLTGSHEPGFREGETSATLLQSLRMNETTRAAAASADIILIATGPNELDMAFDPSLAGTCGGADQADCIRELGDFWKGNFNAILTEIETLREGKPTAIRLVDAANPFVSVPEMMVGMPEGFATGNGALIFQLLNDAMCDAATKHGAVCVDVRPILNGPTMDQPVDENSAASMRAIADALLATGLPELGI
jgi:hypothetical protein